MRGKIITIIFITVIGALLSRCIVNPKTEPQTAPSAASTSTSISGSTSAATPSQTAVSPQELESTITLSGAWILYPISVGWGEDFHRLHPKVRVSVSTGGAGIVPF